MAQSFACVHVLDAVCCVVKVEGTVHARLRRIVPRVIVLCLCECECSTAAMLTLSHPHPAGQLVRLLLIWLHVTEIWLIAFNSYALLCTQVTAATTQTMLLLTTAASTIVYAQLGDIPWQYAAVMMPTAFVATLAGQFAIDWVVKKLGRSSVVVIVLAAFFVVACLLTLYVLIDSLTKVAADPVGASVPGRICSK